MKRIYFYTTLISITAIVIMGCANHHIRKGDNYYEHYGFSKAIKHYEKAYDKTNDARVERNLANSYVNVGKLKDAEDLYAKVVERNSHAKIDYLNYAKVLVSRDKHQEAIPWIKKYLEYNNKDIIAQMLLASCNSVTDRFRDTTLYELEPVIEGDFANAFSVVEYNDGIVFAADKEVFFGKKKAQWTGNSYLNLYYTERDEDGDWLSPTLLKGDVSGPFHDGPATFSEDGKTVYFTRSNYRRRQLATGEDEVSNLKIFKATLVDDKWKNLEEFPYNSDDYSVGHPTLTQDGKIIYFTSDMPGGLGGTDIYRSELIDGRWTEPENLGEKVNTRGNEMFPYIHTDGSLYFSSDSHNSMGGLDVFITYFTGEEWATPENLNYPLNTTKDDFAFSLSKDNKTGFVSSSRAEQDKMYAFKKNDPTFMLYGFARKKGERVPVAGVTVEITNAKTNEVTSMVSDENGKFKLKLSPETEYLLLCTKEGCFTRTDNVSTVNLKFSENFYADFEVEEIVIDKTIVLENIYYDFDKWDIRLDAAAELDKLVKLLEDNPNIEIEMGSHTDSRGADNYNLVLSSKRAMSAVFYLVRQGIDPNRLTWKGYGESMLVNECKDNELCHEHKHQDNRRTEFKVTKINK